MSGPEAHIQAAILEAIGGRPDARLWRNNKGVATSGDGKRFVKFGGLPGAADLSGILAGGRRLEIEVKAPGEYPTKDQRAFGAMVQRFGGVYIVARSVAEAIAGVEAALAEGGSK